MRKPLAWRANFSPMCWICRAGCASTPSMPSANPCCGAFRWRRDYPRISKWRMTCAKACACARPARRVLADPAQREAIFTLAAETDEQSFATLSRDFANAGHDTLQKFSSRDIATMQRARSGCGRRVRRSPAARGGILAARGASGRGAAAHRGSRKCQRQELGIGGARLALETSRRSCERLGRLADHAFHRQGQRPGADA